MLAESPSIFRKPPVRPKALDCAPVAASPVSCDRAAPRACPATADGVDADEADILDPRLGVREGVGASIRQLKLAFGHIGEFPIRKGEGDGIAIVDRRCLRQITLEHI
jgi:hypothetical protein